MPFSGTFFQNGLGLREIGETLLTKGNLVGQVQPFRQLQVALVGPFTQLKQLADLGPEPVLDFKQPFVADRLALGGIGVNLAAVQTDVAQLEHTSRLCQEQDLHKQLLDLRQEGLAKGGNGIVVGVQTTRYEPK